MIQTPQQTTRPFFQNVHRIRKEYPRTLLDCVCGPKSCLRRLLCRVAHNSKTISKRVSKPMYKHIIVQATTTTRHLHKFASYRRNGVSFRRLPTIVVAFSRQRAIRFPALTTRTLPIRQVVVRVVVWAKCLPGTVLCRWMPLLLLPIESLCQGNILVSCVHICPRESRFLMH